MCAKGFRALKIKLGFGIDDDLAVMRAIKRRARERQEVMIDVNHAYGVAEAIRLGRELEDMGWRLRWYEEPVVQEDLDGYAEVRRALATPIAGGENEYTLFGFKQLLAKRAVDIAQPDICIAGGFTGCRHIVALAHAHGVQVNPHVWASAVGQAASLQLIAAIPVANHSLYPKDILLEFDTSSHPFRNELTELSAQTKRWLGGDPAEAGIRNRSFPRHHRTLFHSKMKPANLVIIMSDEHDPRWMGCSGNRMMHTPNLDRLAARGLRFTDAYTTCPICVPARAAFAVGKYIHQIGYWDNADAYDGTIPSWHHRLRDAGHRVVSVGKLHFRSTDDDNGFSEAIVPMNVFERTGDLYGLLRGDDMPARADGKKLAGLAGPGRVRVHLVRPRDRLARADLAARAGAEGARQAVGAVRVVRRAALPADRAAALVLQVPVRQDPDAEAVSREEPCTPTCATRTTTPATTSTSRTRRR